MIGVRSGINEYGQPAEEVISGYVGEFKYFGFSDVPPHCLACDGSEVSRETYSELFAVFGTTFGAGDGVSTFNLPDLRGAFLRCIGGNAAELGVEQEDAIREITGQFILRATQPATGTERPSISGASGAFSISRSGSTGDMWNASTASEEVWNCNFSASNVVSTAAEVRPVNVAVNICVVFE